MLEVDARGSDEASYQYACWPVVIGWWDAGPGYSDPPLLSLIVHRLLC
jgi:hypothetical protein